MNMDGQLNRWLQVKFFFSIFLSSPYVYISVFIIYEYVLYIFYMYFVKIK
jgi:hypothetical protein